MEEKKEEEDSFKYENTSSISLTERECHPEIHNVLTRIAYTK